MPLGHVLYENEVLESKLTDLLNTKLNTRSFMTVNTELKENIGMKKVINVYSYEGKVEKVAKGAKNTVRGKVTYAPKDYTVKVAQQVFDYYDEDAMQDPLVIDAGMDGSSTLMVNEINDDFIAELEKATLTQKYGTKINYDAVVDAITLMNIEDESGLFLLIGTDLKGDIRKDADFKSARQGEILFKGQIGDICGVPVAVSKLCPVGTAFLATKEAVTAFIKKEAEVEQDREKEERLNTVIMRQVNLVALTDATKVVKLVAGTAA